MRFWLFPACLALAGCGTINLTDTGRSWALSLCQAESGVGCDDPEAALPPSRTVDRVGTPETEPAPRG